MSSAKLQVRPILLKKIFFVIFFNNHLAAYERRRGRQKEKIRNGFFLLLSRPNLQFCRSLPHDLLGAGRVWKFIQRHGKRPTAPSRASRPNGRDSTSCS